MISALNPLNLYRSYRLNCLLAEFSRRAGECESPEDVYRHMESVLTQVVDFDRVVVRMIDEGAKTITDSYVASEFSMEWDRVSTRPFLTSSLTGTIAATAKPILIPDCHEKAAQSQYPALIESASVLPSLMGVPLVHRNSVVGVLVLRSKKRHAFSDRDLDTVQLIASQVTPTVVNSRQLLQLQREVHERTVLAEIGRLVSSSIDFGLVWDEFVGKVKELVPYDRVVMALLGDDNRTIMDRYITGIEIPDWDESPERSLTNTPASQILESKTGRIISTEENDRFSLKRLGYRMSERTGLKSFMYAPLVAGDRLIGTFSVRAKAADAYSEADLALFERIAVQIGGAVAASELYARSMKLAEEKAARIGLELRNRQLAQSNRTRSRFVSAISHELRTPLTSMIAFTDILRRNKSGTLAEKELEYLEVVKRNGARLKDLIDNLLDIASIESDNLRLTRAQVSLREAVESAVESVQAALEPGFQRVTVNCSEGDFSVSTDVARLDQILTNMLRHAAKSSRDYAEITVDMTSEGGQVSIAVIDQGEGLSADEVDLVFEEFGRLDDESNKANEGRGLGLPLSRQLARALGGDIEITSVPGEGSTLVLTLPLDMDHALQQPLAS